VARHQRRGGDLPLRHLHALDPAAQWRTPAYEAAYRKAQVVWFEADLGRADALTVSNILSEYGVDPDKGLSEKLAPADLTALKGQADLARIDHLRPWAAAMMLSMQPVLAGDARIDAGADISVTREAQAGGKRIKVFETLEDQARLFASLPEPAEVAYLTDVIHARAHPAPRQPRPLRRPSEEAQPRLGRHAHQGNGGRAGRRARQRRRVAHDGRRRPPRPPEGPRLQGRAGAVAHRERKADFLSC
jgi:hypothetical protein